MSLKVDIEKRLGDFFLKAKFEMEDETIAILGPSGSGKTQLLKCIAGVEKPDKGEIVLNGRILFDSDKKINIKPKDRNIGLLFQNYALFPNFTVEENILFASKDKEYAKSFIEKFKLTDVKDNYPSQLSGGQSQRCAMARMLAVKPEIILFDEPFSALDNYLKYRIEMEIRDIISKFNGPSILVSHDRNEVYRMADNIGVMDDGALSNIVDKHKFFDNPKTVINTRLTGCKNISRIEKANDNEINAIDWGVKLKGFKDNGINYVGYRAHYFELVDNKDEANYFKCYATRIIEDTFSVSICFRTLHNSCNSDDSEIIWIVSKEEWTNIKDRVENKNFCLKLDPKKLILLER